MLKFLLIEKQNIFFNIFYTFSVIPFFFMIVILPHQITTELFDLIKTIIY